MPALADTTVRLLGQEPLAGRLPTGEQLRIAEMAARRRSERTCPLRIRVRRRPRSTRARSGPPLPPALWRRTARQVGGFPHAIRRDPHLPNQRRTEDPWP